MNLDDRSDWEALAVTRAAEVADGEWFAAHPTCRSRYRLAFHGELGMTDPYRVIHVVQQRAGSRTRTLDNRKVPRGTGAPRPGPGRAEADDRPGGGRS